MVSCLYGVGPLCPARIDRTSGTICQTAMASVLRIVLFGYLHCPLHRGLYSSKIASHVVDVVVAVVAQGTKTGRDSI